LTNYIKLADFVGENRACSMFDDKIGRLHNRLLLADFIDRSNRPNLLTI